MGPLFSMKRLAHFSLKNKQSVTKQVSLSDSDNKSYLRISFASCSFACRFEEESRAAAVLLLYTDCNCSNLELTNLFALLHFQPLYMNY